MLVIAILRLMFFPVSPTKPKSIAEFSASGYTLIELLATVDLAQFAVSSDFRHR